MAHGSVHSWLAPRQNGMAERHGRGIAVLGMVDRKQRVGVRARTRARIRKLSREERRRETDPPRPRPQ